MNKMIRYSDIKHLQQILLMRRFLAYLLVLKYFEKIGYVYDKNGNRTSAPRLNVPIKMSQPMTAAYNTANQMTTLNGYPLTYDDNGNLLTLTRSCGITSYTWNVRNQLIALDGFDDKCQPVNASFKYDALGRRIEKTVNGEIINYLYDNLDIVQEVEGGTVTVNYIRTLNIDEPLARIKTDGTIRYYQQDALGSVIALTDETGTIKAQYVYSPFGVTDIIGEPNDNPFQFAGRENDGTGLLFERNRYDSLELNRYISPDPIGFAGGDVNFYARVGGNPINWIDPLGLLLADPNTSIGRTPRKNSSQPCIYGCHPPSPSPKPPKNWTKEQKMRVCEMNCHLACEGLYLACGLHSLPTSMSTCALGCFYFCHFLVGD